MTLVEKLMEVQRVQQITLDNHVKKITIECENQGRKADARTKENMEMSTAEGKSGNIIAKKRTINPHEEKTRGNKVRKQMHSYRVEEMKTETIARKRKTITGKRKTGKKKTATSDEERTTEKRTTNTRDQNKTTESKAQEIMNARTAEEGSATAKLRTAEGSTKGQKFERIVTTNMTNSCEERTTKRIGQKRKAHTRIEETMITSRAEVQTRNTIAKKRMLKLLNPHKDKTSENKAKRSMSDCRVEKTTTETIAGKRATADRVAQERAVDSINKEKKFKSRTEEETTEIRVKFKPSRKNRYDNIDEKENEWGESDISSFSDNSLLDPDYNEQVENSITDSDSSIQLTFKGLSLPLVQPEYNKTLPPTAEQASPASSIQLSFKGLSLPLVQPEYNKTLPPTAEQASQDLDLAKTIKAGRKHTRSRPCVYCGIFQTNLQRHFVRKHKTEEKVIQALRLSTQSRNDVFVNLRKSSILKFNKEAMKEEKPIYECQKI